MTELPKGWQLTALVNVIAHDGLFTDGDWVESKDQDPNGEVRLIQLADIADSTFVDKSNRFLTREKAAELNCTFLRKGDLLVARMPDPLGRCCIFPLLGEEKFVTVVDVCAIRVGTADIDDRYLMRVINSPTVRAQITALQSGSTRKRISRKNLATVLLPVPPLNEQRRIVERIEAMFDEIDHGVENLKKARATLGLYRQSLLKSAFEGHLTADWRARNADKLETPETLLARIQAKRDTRYKSALDDWQKALTDWRENGEEGKKPPKPKRPTDVAELDEAELSRAPSVPTNWGMGRLGLFVDWIEAGKSFKCLETPPEGDQVGVAKVSAVSWGEYDEAESKTCLDADKVNEDWFIRPGDFLLSRANTIELVGASVIVKNVTKKVMLSDKTLRLHFDSGEHRFFLHYLRSPFGRGEIEQRSTGNQESMRNIGQDRIKNIILPICSPEEQAEITRILDERLSAADALEAEIDAGLTRAEALRQSILKQAFSGKLVPQDPKDEPAATLLARIKAEKATKPKKRRAANA